MSDPIGARSLDELPTGRRTTFLRRHEASYQRTLSRTPGLTLDEFLEQRWPSFTRSCSLTLARAWNYDAERPQLARLGSDGRFHPWSAQAGMLCGREIHRQISTWSTDGSRWSIHPQSGGDRENGKRERRWRVRLVNEPVPAETLRWSQRCPLVARWTWPTYFDPTTKTGIVRALLIKDAGTDRCQTCGVAQGELVDHDHLTGLVRGLLCGNCNTHVDDCLHLTGCPFGDYLDAPPAADLGRFHPKLGRRRLQPAPPP